MKLKTIILQNIILAFGIICIYKFLSLKNFYEQIVAWKDGLPIVDGDGVGLTFLGLPIDDDGVHWTDIMGVANSFLILGVLMVVLSIGILIWKSRRIHT